MNDVRAWIVLAAAVSFLAGAAAGVLLERRSAPDAVSGWAAYAERLGDEFDLSPERRAALLVLLDEYDTKLTAVRSSFEARLQSAMEPDLRKVSDEYEGYIRDFVLPQDQRPRYDRMSRPLILAASR